MILRPINFLFQQIFKLLDIPFVEKEFSQINIKERRIQQLKSNLAQPCFKVADLSHLISQSLMKIISKYFHKPPIE